ncbi:MAG: hypothetical protein ACTHN5_16965 [Phycisphaerae bacterium]
MAQPDDFWTNTPFWCYVALGVPVAWLHLKREGASEKDVHRPKTFRWIIILLATIWPVLLLAFLASWIGNKLDGPPRKK